MSARDLGDELPGMVTTVAKRYASGVNHVVTVPREWLRAATSFGVPYTSIHAPAAARCGTRMGSYLGQDLTMMEPGTKVSCRHCVRTTGITAQTKASYQAVHQ